MLEVNAEFAEHYPDLYEKGGEKAVIGVGAAPKTSFNTGKKPTIGTNFQREPFARVVGDVRLGDNVKSAGGRRSAPTRARRSAVGDDAEIEEFLVTFHALKGTSISIGPGLDTDDNIVFHGPLTVGNDLDDRRRRRGPVPLDRRQQRHDRRERRHRRAGGEDG